MTRMIERWFPCAAVTEATESGWGHGKVEKTLFPWFAARPPAQAKAAVICSLLRWPDSPVEQQRVQALVIEAMTGRFAAWSTLVEQIAIDNPGGTHMLDPFSGRGMIPLEAARLGVTATAIDYSPLAVLASHGLTDYPFRDWSREPQLAFDVAVSEPPDLGGQTRLLVDLELVLAEIGSRFEASMGALYPVVAGRRPWAYLHAVTLPCQDCSRRFPLFASSELRKARTRRKGGVVHQDLGQSFFVDVDTGSGRFWTVVHDGPPERAPTLANVRTAAGKKIAGKTATCPFCGHPHPVALHRRLAHEGHGQDELLVVADLDEDRGKIYRAPCDEEFATLAAADAALADEPSFGPGLPARPAEGVAPGNNNIIGPSIYGMRTFGDYMPARQTLGFVRLCRAIGEVAEDVAAQGASPEYVNALATYAAGVVARKVRRSGRAATLDVKVQAAHDIFSNQGSIGYSYDFLEVGLGAGQGTWTSIARSEIATLRNLLTDLRPGRPASVVRGSATALPLRDGGVTAVVTDPPYDEMLAYADSSDVMYVWAKRAVGHLMPEISLTTDEHGAQEKYEEIIVKRVRGEAPDEHRTRAHYDEKIAAAFREMRRVVADDGVVSIVFGSGDPEVWQRLLSAIEQAGLVMTGSWPASTEAGSHQGKANIETTLTMACRPAPADRPSGRKGTVEAEIEAEIRRRYPDWERWGLAPTDMLMAAAGPAMEVVGRYDEVLDARGEHVDIHTFLPLARASVQRAMAVDVDSVALEKFDALTRLALWWVRLYGRDSQAKSELRWQALAAAMDLDTVRQLIPDSGAGVAFIYAREFSTAISTTSPVIDVALALARAADDGLDAMGEVLVQSGRTTDDPFLWAAVKFLADRLPDADEDAMAFSRVLRAKAGVGAAADTVTATVIEALSQRELADRQGKLL